MNNTKQVDIHSAIEKFLDTLDHEDEILELEKAKKGILSENPITVKKHLSDAFTCVTRNQRAKPLADSIWSLISEMEAATIGVVHLAVKSLFESKSPKNRVMFSKKNNGVMMGCIATVVDHLRCATPYFVKMHQQGLAINTASASKVEGVALEEVFKYIALSKLEIGPQVDFCFNDQFFFFICSRHAGYFYDEALNQSSIRPFSVFDLFQSDSKSFFNKPNAAYKLGHLILAMQVIKIEIWSRIFHLHDVLTNTGNFGFVEHDHRLVARIVDFRTKGETFDKIAFDSFLTRNGVLNTDTCVPEVRNIVAIDPGFRIAVMKQVLVTLEGLKFPTQIDAAFNQTARIGEALNRSYETLKNQVSLANETYFEFRNQMLSHTPSYSLAVSAMANHPMVAKDEPTLLHLYFAHFDVFDSDLTSIFMLPWFDTMKNRMAILDGQKQLPLRTFLTHRTSMNNRLGIVERMLAKGMKDHEESGEIEAKFKAYPPYILNCEVLPSKEQISTWVKEPYLWNSILRTQTAYMLDGVDPIMRNPSWMLLFCRNNDIMNMPVGPVVQYLVNAYGLDHVDAIHLFTCRDKHGNTILHRLLHATIEEDSKMEHVAKLVMKWPQLLWEKNNENKIARVLAQGENLQAIFASQQKRKLADAFSTAEANDAKKNRVSQ